MGLASILRLAPLVTIGFPLAVQGQITRYVDCTGTCGGASPCYSTIQAAINASTGGDDLLVLPCTYNELINFSGKAVTLRSTDGADVTTIDGTGLNDSVVKCISGEGPSTVLEAFTITGGAGDTSTGSPRGGGMYNVASSPTVADCIFKDNSADFGGGMYSEGSNPSISGCVFLANVAGNCGGGMANIIESYPDLTNCVFVGNSAVVSGGGMHSAAASPSMINCVFSGNHTDGEGAGMYNEVSFPALTNCTFSENEASQEGGGMRNAWSSNPALTNCILWGNRDVGGTDESAQIQSSPDGTVTVDHSCVQGWTGSLGGTGNFGDDPQFLDADGPDDLAGTGDDNVRLSFGSSCVDKGDNTAVSVTTDLDGNPRIVDGDFDGTATVDAGAYEFQPVIPAVSEWGLVVMALLGLVVGTVMFRAKRQVA